MLKKNDITSADVLGSNSSLCRFESLVELIGNSVHPTPIVRIRKAIENPKLSFFLKLEGVNPFGSIKDRAALYMLRGMQARGELDLKEIVEPTSGNTGIALAGLAAILDTKISVTIPDGVPAEQLILLRMLGATVLATPDDMCPVDHPKDGAIALAHAMALSESGRERYAMPNQYENEDNVRAHYETTGPEIWRQTEGRIRFFFAGYGSCGSLTGIGRYLKEQDSTIQVIAVEPEKGHRIPGLKNLKEAKTPKILDPSVIDHVVSVDNESAYAMTRRLYRSEGLMIGPSTGAIVQGACQFGLDREGVAVALSPDGGSKYTSFFGQMLGDEGLPDF